MNAVAKDVAHDVNVFLEERVRRVAKALLLALAGFFPLLSLLCLLLEQPLGGMWWLKGMLVLSSGVLFLIAPRLTTPKLLNFTQVTCYGIFLAQIAQTAMNGFPLAHLFGILVLAAAANAPMERLGAFTPWISVVVFSASGMWPLARLLGNENLEDAMHVRIPSLMAALAVLEISAYLTYSVRKTHEAEFLTLANDNIALRAKAHALSTRQWSALSRVLKVVGHEARSPFSLMSLCLQRLKTLSDEKERGNLIEKVAHDLQVSLQRVDQTLGRALLWEELPTLQIKSVSLSEFLRDEVSMFFRERNLPSIEIKSCLESTYDISVDRALAGKVLQCLFSNAVEALNGEGVIWVNSSNLAVGAKTYVKIVIGNNGPQISPDILPLLFEPFVCASTPRGLGIGLSLAKKWQSSMGGQIRLLSNEPNRVEFELSFLAGELLENCENQPLVLRH